MDRSCRVESSSIWTVVRLDFRRRQYPVDYVAVGSAAAFVPRSLRNQKTYAAVGLACFEVADRAFWAYWPLEALDLPFWKADTVTFALTANCFPSESGNINCERKKKTSNQQNQSWWNNSVAVCRVYLSSKKKRWSSCCCWLVDEIFLSFSLLSQQANSNTEKGKRVKQVRMGEKRRSHEVYLRYR